MPEISIIVPVYKVEKYLDRCVKSILDQTYTDFELILVDDGSPDNCPAMCDAWAEKDDRIRVVHKENGGLSSARNAGLDIMKGEYVMFVDSDDAVHPEICNILHHFLIAEKADIAICSLLKFNTDSIPDSKNIIITDNCQLYDGAKILRNESIFENCRPSACGKLYTKKIFDSIRFKIGIIYEDLHIYPYILYEAHKIVNCEFPLYYYYFPQTREQSIMRSPLSPSKFIAIDIMYEHYAFYRQNYADRSAMISAYNILIKFAKSSILLDGNKELKKVFTKYYFHYLWKITTIPHRYLSAKNKFIFLSTILPVKRLKTFYKTTYDKEFGFHDPRNL